jgi:hypothetical protein
LLLLGFSGAFRRSELVALDVADLEESDDGLKISIRRSKTDQEGMGATIAVIRGGACCPVKALRAWARRGRDHRGGDLPTGSQRRQGARPAALDQERLRSGQGLRRPCRPRRCDAHSLRAGFLTSAARCGASVFKMRDVSRHKSMDVLQSYVRDADMFRDHAGAGLL